MLDAEKSAPANAIKPNRQFYAKATYRYVGHAAATGDYNDDSRVDVALGSHGYGVPGLPQTGAAYLFWGGGSVGPATDVENADAILYGDGAHDRFGWALATIDWNHDGIDDLAVSSPTTLADEMEYRGSGAHFADLDGDGHDDLLLGAYRDSTHARHGGTASVFLTSGPATCRRATRGPWRGRHFRPACGRK